MFTSFISLYYFSSLSFSLSSPSSHSLSPPLTLSPPLSLPPLSLPLLSPLSLPPLSPSCRLRVVNKDEGSLYVEGFASFSDAKAEDLVPWTPLKTGQPFNAHILVIIIKYVIKSLGYSGLNTHTGLYVLSRIVKNFIAIIAEEARTISDTDSKQL